MISIKGMNKAEVLKALYDHSHVQGMGYLQAVPDGVVTVSHCQMLLDTTGYPYFDYLYGRVLKVDLSGDEFDERLYDRDCGAGAAAYAIKSLNKPKRDEPSYCRIALDSGIQAAVDYGFVGGELKLKFHSTRDVAKMITILESHLKKVEEGAYDE